MKKIGIGLIPEILCVVLSICSCTHREDGRTAENSREYQVHLNSIKPYVYKNVDVFKFFKRGARISVIGKSKRTSYWSEIEKGARQAAKDLNEKLAYTGDDKVRIVYNAPLDEKDIDAQVNILDEELAGYPDALVIAAIEGQIQFDLAARNEVPIIAIDSCNHYPGILCNVMTDNAEAAKTCANKLHDEMQGSGKVLIVVNDSDSGCALERAEGFSAEVYSELTDISVADTVYLDKAEEIKEKIAKERKIRKEDVAEEDVILWLLEQDPDITGIYGTDEEATRLACKGMKKADKGKDVPVVGFDGGIEELESLKKGELTGIVVQNPFGIGYASAVAAFRAISGMDNEPKVDTGYIWVTRDNVDDEAIKPLLYE